MSDIYFPLDFPYNDFKKLGYDRNGFSIRVIKLRNISDTLLASGKWSRKEKTTYCGQFTSDILLQFGCNIEKMTNGKPFQLVNTTMSYYNCLRNKVYEVDSEMAFYCARFGIPVKVLSPSKMIVDGKKYNHSVLIYPLYYEKYDSEKGPFIVQEGWKGLKGYMNDKYAYGKVWKNPMIKYFIFPFSG